MRRGLIWNSLCSEPMSIVLCVQWTHEHCSLCAVNPWALFSAHLLHARILPWESHHRNYNKGPTDWTETDATISLWNDSQNDRFRFIYSSAWATDILLSLALLLLIRNAKEKILVKCQNVRKNDGLRTYFQPSSFSAFSVGA
jgi:hypothetical protein